MDVYELYGPVGDELTHKRREVLARTVSWIKQAYREGREWDAYVYFTSITDFYEILWLQLQLTAQERTAIKRFQLTEREMGNDERERDLSDEQKSKG